MHCPNCNKKIKETAKFCGYCGTKVNVETHIVQEVVNEPDHTLRIASKNKLFGYINPKLLIFGTLGLIIITILLVVIPIKKIGTFKDPRDGKIYKTVKIGKQVWMAENLAFKPNTGNYWAYDNSETNVAKYGYLYDWETSRNVCPTGWHLPSDAEWKKLVDFLGSNSGTKLKAQSGWSSNGNGTDIYGFSAFPGGSWSYGDDFYNFGDYGYYWSSTEYNTTNAWGHYLYYSYSDIYRYYYYKKWGLSVRCIKNDK